MDDLLKKDQICRMMSESHFRLCPKVWACLRISKKPVCRSFVLDSRPLAPYLCVSIHPSTVPE
jgi:hypothetical protein